METILLNVGGTHFETTRKTLDALSDWKLSDEETLQMHYREKENDYYFDRDPLMFSVILNYLRTSQLHLPTHRCGPSIKAELDYWQVSDARVQRCCWSAYNKWNSTLESLTRLEKDRKGFSGQQTKLSEAEDTNWGRHRAKVWQFLNRSNSSVGAKIFGIVSLIFVVVSITTFVLSTTKYFEPEEKVKTVKPTTLSPVTSVICATEKPEDQPMPEKYHQNDFLDVIDIICLIFFVLEYVVRLIYSPRKLHFLFSFLSIVDAVALIPDFIEHVVFNIDPNVEASLEAINFITILRVLRICRIFRLIRHSTGLWVLIYTLKASVREFLLLVWLMGIGIVLFASLIYVAEDKRDFYSIPDGFWWAIITMTTVGYGDMSPKTAWGKVIGSLCAMLGLLVIGFSVPSLVNNFLMYYSQIEFASQMEERQKVEKVNLEDKEKAVNNNKVKLNNVNSNTGALHECTTQL